MTPAGRLVVGLDLGTSGMKGVALDEAGAVVARGQAAYPTARPEPGASEQDARDWIAAVLDVSAQIRALTGDAPWAAIALSGMLPTLVTVGPDGEPVGAAITWEDARAEAEGDALRDAVGAEALYRRTGQWVDGRYLLPMLARLARVEPQRVAAASALLGAKDLVYAWLTGEAVTDPSTATGFGCFDLSAGAWDPEVIEAAGASGAALRLPVIRPSSSAAPLAPAAAAAMGVSPGLPVVLGAADSVLGAAGMGVRAPGDVAYVAGTSTIVLGVTDRVRLDPHHRFLVTPMAEPGLFGMEMDLLATGSAFRWLAGVLGLDGESQLLELAAVSQAADPPVFLPYVAPGEQGALWDPSLSGSLRGLHVGHERADIARALVTGIVLESRRCLGTLEEHGFDRSPLRVSGGSAADRWFREQLADATGRIVEVCDGTDTDRSAMGAAALAAAHVGSGAPSVSTTGDRTAPNAAREEAWTRAFVRHEVARVGDRPSR